MDTTHWPRCLLGIGIALSALGCLSPVAPPVTPARERAAPDRPRMAPEAALGRCPAGGSAVAPEWSTAVRVVRDAGSGFRVLAAGPRAAEGRDRTLRKECRFRRFGATGDDSIALTRPGSCGTLWYDATGRLRLDDHPL
jgi:hypothetical protein